MTEQTMQTIKWRPGGQNGGESPPFGMICLMVLSLGKPFDNESECIVGSVGASGKLYPDRSDLPLARGWEYVTRWAPCCEVLYLPKNISSSKS